MQNAFENTAKSFMTSPQGIRIIKGLDKYNAAMNTPAGKQLLTMMAGSGSDALKSAAQASLNAQKDPGRALLQNLLSSKDGAALAAKVIEVLGI